jgi:hypothetical protein
MLIYFILPSYKYFMRIFISDTCKYVFYMSLCLISHSNRNTICEIMFTSREGTGHCVFESREEVHKKELSVKYIILYSKSKSSPSTRHGGAWGERRYSSYSFTTSALDGGEWSASRLGRALPPGKGPPGTHCTGGWVGPRAGLDTEVRGKILCPPPGIEPRSPGRPARSQTLYCLS